MPCDDTKVAGFIEGLRLPAQVWDILRQENITTVSELAAVADRVERFNTIGPAAAKQISAELARAIRCEKQPRDQRRFLSPWAA